MGIGLVATQPAAIPGQPLIFSQQAWPSLPATLGRTSTIASSISTTPARAATEAVDNTAQVDVLPVLVTTQEKGGNDEVVQMARDTPIITTELETSAPASTKTDVAVATTTVEHDEYGDAAGNVAYKELYNSSPCRSTKSRKHKQVPDF